MKRLGIVDALRGIATLAVCFFHLNYHVVSHLPSELAKSLLSYGWLGVEVFFVISGFVIPYSMHRAGYRLPDYGLFVVKRVARVDPPYFIAIALTLFLSWLSAKAPGYRGERFQFSTTQLLFHVAYLNAFYPEEWYQTAFWTLAIEFQFYLLVGLIFPLIAHERPVPRLSIFAILGAASLFIPQQHAFIPCWLFLFMLGILAFQRHAGLVGGAGFWVILVLLVLGAWHNLGWLIAIVGAAAACAIVFLNTTNKVLLFFGSLSYSLYLIHGPIATRIFNIGGRYFNGLWADVLLFCFAVSVCIGVAFLLHRYVEVPAMRWSSKIKYRHRPSH
jgi:peptidoglycan/LPS O-acetylase OafA/YrhL